VLPPNRSRCARRTALHLVVGLVATLLALMVWSRAPWRQVPELVARAGGRLPLALLPWPVSLACDAWAWRALMEPLGLPRVTLLRLWSIRLVSEAVLLSLPGGSVLAEIVKIGVFCRLTGSAAAPVAAAVVAKKVLVIAAEVPYLWAAALLGWWKGASSRLTAAVFAAGWVAVAVAWTVGWATARAGWATRLARAAQAYERKGGRWAALARPLVSLAGAETVVRKLLDGSRASRRGRRRAFTAVLVAWSLEGVDLGVLAWAAGAPLRPWQALLCDAWAGFVRASAFLVPGGWGAQDLGLVTALETVGHLAPSSAAWVDVMKRAKEVFFVVTGYSLGFAIKAAWRKDRRERGQPTTSKR